MCWNVNLELKVIILPPEEDPASFLNKNNTINSLINTAQDIFLFFLDSLGAQFNTKPLNQKITITRSFLNVIITISDPLKRDILLQKAALTFDIAFESLKEELYRLEQENLTHKTEKTASLPVNKEELPLPMLEKKIFCAIINDIDLLNGENRKRHIKYLPSPLREILVKLEELKEKTSSITFNYFFETLDELEKKYVSMLLLNDQEKIDVLTFDKLLIQLQKKQWKIVVHNIKAQLTQAKKEGDTTKISMILQDFMELQNKILQ